MPHVFKLCMSIAVAVAMHPFAASGQSAPAPAAPGAVPGAVPGESPIAAQIEASIGQDYRPDAPGAVVLVVQDGKTVFRKAYGLADAARGTPLTPDMQLRLGSITKQFTSTAILMLVDEGKIKLDDDITRYLPDYPTQGTRITVEQLLNHTSGIASFTSKPGYAQHMNEAMSVRAMVDAFKNDPRDFAPGTRHQYNNSGYFLLGAIIEKVSGQSYADFLAQRIFTPLGMRDTAYEGHERGTAARAVGHTRSANGFAPSLALDMSQPYAAGALVSTVDDLARWDGAVSAGKLLTPATWQRAFNKTVLADGKTIDYGFGWTITTLRGVPVIAHGGAINGFRTYALRVPSAHLYVAVLRNTDSGAADPQTVASKVAALVIGKPFPRYAPVALDAATLDHYAGAYRGSTPGETAPTIVERDGSQLRLQRGGREPVLLTAFSRTGFYVPGELDSFEFIRDSAGKVVALMRQRDGAEQVSRRIGPAPAPRTVVALAPATFDKLVGRYQMHPDLVLELTREGARYFASATRQPKIEIFPASATVFFAKVVNAELRVEQDAATGATVLVLDHDGNTITGRKLP